jgi:hypothetical protein
MASSQNFFVLFRGGLNLPAGSDTPQNKILWSIRPSEQAPAGIRPHGTQSCGVSDPAEQWQSCLHFIADTCSVRSDTSQNNILRALQGIRPRGTNPAEQHLNTNISANSKLIQKYSRV